MIANKNLNESVPVADEMATCSSVETPGLGALHAIGTDVDKAHANALTKQQKSILSGDTASNQLSYHGQCNISKWNECNKIDGHAKSTHTTWEKS